LLRGDEKQIEISLLSQLFILSKRKKSLLGEFVSFFGMTSKIRHYLNFSIKSFSKQDKISLNVTKYSHNSPLLTITVKDEDFSLKMMFSFRTYFLLSLTNCFIYISIFRLPTRQQLLIRHAKLRKDVLFAGAMQICWQQTIYPHVMWLVSLFFSFCMRKNKRNYGESSVERKKL
jgi:hypothetical protein